MTVYEGFAELETQGWSDDNVASGYVGLFSEASDRAIPAILAQLEEPRHVLDLCCGQGNVTEALHKAGHEVTGADFSKKMLSFAQERLPNGEFFEADAQNLPFGNAEFDAVVCSFGLMHVPDQPKALSEVRRVLRPGGRFVMTSWCGPDVSAVFRLFYGSVKAHGHSSVAMPESPDFHQFANEDTARGLLKTAGLRLEHFEQVPCYWWLDDPEKLADIFQKGAPRGGYLLKQQPDANLRAIRTAIGDGVRDAFADGDGWRVPIPAALASARAI